MAVQRVKIERDPVTGLLVGSVPGVPGAHTQGETAEEVQRNLVEVIEELDDQTRAELAQVLDELNTAAAMRGARPAWRIAGKDEE
jgi:hypothetical protein